ncbi:MAG: alpha-amylase family glycosyl hydrolase [Bryobacteraceae bacterium]|jgi:glycosidase
MPEIERAMAGGVIVQEPFLYEINTWAWLNGLSRKYARAIQLGSVPAEEWNEIASWGFDAVWLMGVWERSPAAAAIAREHPDLQASYRSALPDFTPADVVGSPYAVHRYVVDAHLGGPDGLKQARVELARRNLSLILDFVPNHVAVDHPWTVEHPEYFVHEADGSIAHGRDPYFPPWTDTAQINAYHPALRSAYIATLQDIALQCDGVRCDMAMLLLNDIFRETWGDKAGATPGEEFWKEAIPAVPGLTWIAEVYWDLEWTMQQLGFNYCYDKRLYDRLAYENAGGIRQHLAADIGHQGKLVRMIENHDEPRAAAIFPYAKEAAAATMIATLPGAKLFHQGQFEGRKIKMPVQLGRWPDEPVDSGLLEFYRALLQECRDPEIRHGEWRPLETGNENLLSWTRGIRTIAINYSDAPAGGFAPWETRFTGPRYSSSAPAGHAAM